LFFFFFFFFFFALILINLHPWTSYKFKTYGYMIFWFSDFLILILKLEYLIALIKIFYPIPDFGFLSLKGRDRALKFSWLIPQTHDNDFSKSSLEEVSNILKLSSEERNFLLKLKLSAVSLTLIHTHSLSLSKYIYIYIFEIE